MVGNPQEEMDRLLLSAVRKVLVATHHWNGGSVGGRQAKEPLVPLGEDLGMSVKPIHKSDLFCTEDFGKELLLLFYVLYNGC